MPIRSIAPPPRPLPDMAPLAAASAALDAMALDDTDVNHYLRRASVVLRLWRAAGTRNWTEIEHAVVAARDVDLELHIDFKAAAKALETWHAISDVVRRLQTELSTPHVSWDIESIEWEALGAAESDGDALVSDSWPKGCVQHERLLHGATVVLSLRQAMRGQMWDTVRAVLKESGDADQVAPTELSAAR